MVDKAKGQHGPWANAPLCHRSVDRLNRRARAGRARTGPYDPPRRIDVLEGGVDRRVGLAVTEQELPSLCRRMLGREFCVMFRGVGSASLADRTRRAESRALWSALQGMKKPVKAGSAETGFWGVNGSAFPFSGRTSPWSYETGIGNFDRSASLNLERLTYDVT